MHRFENAALRASGHQQDFLCDSEDDPPESAKRGLERKDAAEHPHQQAPASKVIQTNLSTGDAILSQTNGGAVSVAVLSPTPSSPTSARSAESDEGLRLQPDSDHSSPELPASPVGHSVAPTQAALEHADVLTAAKSEPHHPSLPGERMPSLGKSLSWVSPKLQARTTRTGCGLFVVSPVKKHDHLILWTGRIVSAEEALNVMSTNEKHYILQIGDGFYQAPLQEEREPADLSNHSCEPTAGFGAGSPVCLTAMRDLAIGEEVVFDYGMCETDERLWEPMECACGSKYCRGLITAHDWKREELYERYEGWWAPHVQRLVTARRAALAAAKALESAPPAPKTLAVDSAVLTVSAGDVESTPHRRRMSTAKTLSTASAGHAESVVDDDDETPLPGTAGSGYYKAPQPSSHWLGKLVYPVLDVVLARFGLARVAL